jgi:hypothetical protein
MFMGGTISVLLSYDATSLSEGEGGRVVAIK